MPMISCLITRLIHQILPRFTRPRLVTRRRSSSSYSDLSNIASSHWIVHHFTSTFMALFGASRSRLLLFQSQRYIWFLARFGGHRFPFPHSSLISFSFTTLDDPVNTLDDGLVSGAIKHLSTVDERYVLDELRSLLPVSCNKSIPNLFPENRVEEQCGARTADGYLMPEEKLRGVFLQKLKGQTAIEHALASAGVDLTLDVVRKVLNKGSLGGEAMVAFFKWAIKQPSIPEDTLSYNIILKALGMRKFFNFMMDVLRDMTSAGVTPNIESLSILMDSFIRAHRISKAFQMLGSLEEIGLKFDTQSLNILLQCMCRRTHVGAASQIFNSVKGKIPFSSSTYNIMIGGWSKYGKISETQKFLKAMEDDGFRPDCLTYTYLIEGLGRAGLVDSAVEVFNKMAEKGCSIDTSAYNAMLSNFILMGDFDKCMIYYKQMLSSDCVPNNDTYTKLIIALMKTRKVANALEMFDEMLERGVLPSTGSITSFIKLLCGFGPPHAAMEVYKRARKAGCQISETAYKLLLMRLSRFGKCGMMLTIWDEMQECGYSADVQSYEYIINGLCNIGHLDNAVLVMEECLSRGFCPSRLICSKLNNKLLASEKVQIAYKLFLKIKDARRADHMQRCWRANGWHF